MLFTPEHNASADRLVLDGSSLSHSAHSQNLSDQSSPMVVSPFEDEQQLVSLNEQGKELALLSKPKQPRNAVRGEALWATVSRFEFNFEQEASIFSVKELPSSVNDALKDISCGGGGYQNKGGANGRTLSSGDKVFDLRCKSHTAWGCPHEARVQLAFNSNAIIIRETKGWAHLHTGVCQLKRGVPPQIEAEIEALMTKNPRIKCQAVKNHLWEIAGWDQDVWQKRVHNYFYHERKRTPSLLMGVSSYATVVAQVEANLMQKRLCLLDASINTTGVVGWKLDPDTGDAFIMYSTFKMGMFAWEQLLSGYSKGQVHADLTFKVLKEQMPMLVMSVHDVCQKGKCLAYGPLQSATRAGLAQAMRPVKLWLDAVARILYNLDFPNSWPAALQNEIKTKYAVIIAMLQEMKAAGKPCPEYDPTGSMADFADEVTGAIRDVFPTMVQEREKKCWVHLWRFVMKNLWRLTDKSEERKNLLYTDLAFLHEIPYQLLLIKAKGMFVKKWKEELGEEDMVMYLQKEALRYNFSRTANDPGEATDQNTLERMNCTLKDENHFNAVEGLGNFTERSKLVGYRLSRDTEFFALAPAVNFKEWQKAQKLIKKGWDKLGFKYGASFVMPSEKLLDSIPVEHETEKKKKAYISKWAKEFVALMRNQATYYKLLDGSWDFDILTDMIFSFWVLTKIPSTHPSKKALFDVGIKYTCTCPQYLHYHVCKHALAAGIGFDKTPVPTRFSSQAVGKRKAPAGATLSKRAHCLHIDD